MEMEIVTIDRLKVVGIRISDLMANLDMKISQTHNMLKSRIHEIQNVKNPNVMYGISPPNYKGNTGVLDFYVCVEVDPFENLPHGMVNITVDPAQYACCTYKGQMTNKVEAYDFTTKWLKENGYEYFDAAYYFEVYDEKTNLPDSTSDNNTIKIHCPVKKIDN